MIYVYMLYGALIGAFAGFIIALHVPREKFRELRGRRDAILWFAIGLALAGAFVAFSHFLD